MKIENEKSLDGVFRDRRPLSTLWCFVGSDRWKIAGALVVYIFKHSPTWILPIVAGKMINYLVDAIKTQSHESFRPMLVYALIMLGLYLSNVPLHMVFASLFVKACRNIEARLRSSLVRRLQQLSISFHTSTSTGRLQAKLLRDVEAIQRLMTQMVHTIVPGLLSVVFILSYCIYKQPEVALFFVAAVPVASVLRYVFRKAINKRNREFRSRVEVMSGKFAEMISMIPVARAHALEENEVARMDEELAEVRAKGL
ncbi:MAG: ABC transporter ATP-binding protein, partial [Planctomycetaceae bacterium]